MLEEDVKDLEREVKDGRLSLKGLASLSPRRLSCLSCLPLSWSLSLFLSTCGV
jgi:hypothetical protein